MRTCSLLLAIVSFAGCAGEGATASPDAGLTVDSGPDDAGLSSDAGTATDSGADAGLPPAENPLITARPYRLVIPSKTDGTPMPLVLLLHGYTATGVTQDLYFGASATAEANGFLLVSVDGLIDSRGQRYWNATDGCCDIDKTGVDDVAYLSAVIDDVVARHRVDQKRIFVIGHSNGAFMAHRLACDLSPRIAGIVSLAGETWLDDSRCKPTEGVAVLQVQGTLDAVIPYNGGSAAMARFPGAEETVKDWAVHNGCAETPTEGADLDLDLALLGNETSTKHYERCAKGAAELWTIRLGSHVPVFTSNWGPAWWGFLAAHPKP